MERMESVREKDELRTAPGLDFTGRADFPLTEMGKVVGKTDWEGIRVGI